MAARAHSGARDLQWPHLLVASSTPFKKRELRDEKLEVRKDESRREAQHNEPGSVELDEPHVLAVHDSRVEVAVRQMNYIGTFARALHRDIVLMQIRQKVTLKRLERKK